MGMIIAVALVEPDGAMHTLTGPVCEGVIRETGLKQRTDDGA